MEKLKIIVCAGLPAAGKTTWAKDIIAKYPEQYKRINKDDLRAMLDGSKWTKDNEKFVLEVRDLLIKKAMDDGYNVIVDDTNLHEKHLKRINDIVKSHNATSRFGYSTIEGTTEFCNGDKRVLNGIECPGCPNCKPVVEVEEKFFDIPLKEAIERDKKRTIGHVGEKIIRDMYNRYLKKDDKVLKLEQDYSLPHCIICDVDGTIAERTNRGPFEWSKVGEDAPKKEIIEIVNRFRKDKFVIFFSGRKECCREQTAKWIFDNVFDGVTDTVLFKLYMRKDNDDRKDSIVKKELFDEHVRRKYYVEFVLDDRNQVVDMWRNEIGLTCLQVQEGSF